MLISLIIALLIFVVFIGVLLTVSEKIENKTGIKGLAGIIVFTVLFIVFPIIAAGSVSAFMPGGIILLLLAMWCGIGGCAIIGAVSQAKKIGGGFWEHLSFWEWKEAMTTAKQLGAERKQYAPKVEFKEVTYKHNKKSGYDSPVNRRCIPLQRLHDSLCELQEDYRDHKVNLVRNWIRIGYEGINRPGANIDPVYRAAFEEKVAEAKKYFVALGLPFEAPPVSATPVNKQIHPSIQKGLSVLDEMDRKLNKIKNDAAKELVSSLKNIVEDCNEAQMESYRRFFVGDGTGSFTLLKKRIQELKKEARLRGQDDAALQYLRRMAKVAPTKYREKWRKGKQQNDPKMQTDSLIGHFNSISFDICMGYTFMSQSGVKVEPAHKAAFDAEVKEVQDFLKSIGNTQPPPVVAATPPMPSNTTVPSTPSADSEAPPPASSETAAPSKPQWYYYDHNGDKISATVAELKALAQRGVITPGTTIENAEGKTAIAKKVKGLFPNYP